MSQGPDFIVDPDGNVRDVRGQKKYLVSDSPPPPQRPTSKVHRTSSNENQPGVGIILIPIGMILTLILTIARSCGSTSTTITSNWDTSSYSSGLSFYANGEYQMALIEFNSAISSNPDFAEAYNGRGLVYEALGKYDQALADFNKAIKLEPDSPLPYNNRGCLFSITEQYDQAVSDFSQAIQLKTDLAKAYMNRGLVNEYLGFHEAAIADFNNAIRYTPEDSFLALHSQRPNATSGDIKDPLLIGIPGNEKEMELKSSFADLPTVYLNRGFAYANLGDTSRALEDWQKANELSRKAGDQDRIPEIIPGDSMIILSTQTINTDTSSGFAP